MTVHAKWSKPNQTRELVLNICLLLLVGHPLIGGWICHKYHFCRDKHDKHVLVATKHVFCPHKSTRVATKVLSRQAYFCRDRHTFVATKDVFVATKMILVAVPAKNT